MKRKSVVPFTARTLIALQDDLENLKRSHERVRAQILALSAHHGVTLPAPAKGVSTY